MEMDLVSMAMLTWKIVLSEQQMIQHIGSENINSHPVIVEDSTVIYARSHYGAGKEIIQQSREL